MITYQKVLNFAYSYLYDIEEWEWEDGYAITVWTSTYTKNNYYFDKNKTFIEWEKENVSPF